MTREKLSEHIDAVLMGMTRVGLREREWDSESLDELIQIVLSFSGFLVITKNQLEENKKLDSYNSLRESIHVKASNYTGHVLLEVKLESPK